MELEILAKYYNDCNPDEALDPTDPRNVDLDACGPKDEPVRGENWVHRLARQVELSRHPVCKLFTGLRGSGKSTELHRLAARLRREDGKHLLPVLIDAETVIDLNATIDVPDIIMACIAETEVQLLKEEGQDPTQPLVDGYPTRFWNWLAKTNVELSRADIGISLGPAKGGLVVEMKTQPTLRQRIRDTVAAHLTGFLKDAHGELVLLNERARKLGYAGLIVIFDSLEKLQGTSSNWHEVLASAEKIFINDAPYLQLPVHVLYTIPPALALRLRVEVQYLPMIKLQSRDGQVFQPGVDAARALVRKRIPDLILEALLGRSHVEERIHQLIAWSGGYPREIVRLLGSLLEVGDASISKVAFDRVLSRAGDTYRRVVLASGEVEWLARVAVHQSLIMDNDGQREAADRMLANNVVLRYLNQTEWFDLHPAVLELREVREAIARLRAVREQGAA